MTYTTFIRPHKSSSSQARTAQFVQTTTDFCLRNGDTKIVPDGVGYIYLLQRVESDQAFVCVQSRTLRGWVAARQLIPLNHAEAFFSKQIEANPPNAFAS